MEAEAGMDPIALFGGWLSDAQQGGVPEPLAMTLATVGSSTISCRVVLLRAFDGQRLRVLHATTTVARRWTWSVIRVRP